MHRAAFGRCSGAIGHAIVANDLGDAQAIVVEHAVLWNTIDMDAAVDRFRAEGLRGTAMLQQIDALPVD